MELATFLLEDYRQKVSYLTAHLQRMWTRFNFFLTIQFGLLAFLFTSNRDLSNVALYFATAEAVVALLWYVFGAQDRYLVLLYRQHVKDAAQKLVSQVKTPDQAAKDAVEHYVFVGDTSSANIDNAPFEWRSESFSITRLAVIFPLIVLLVWLVMIVVLII
jgi:hypothetical protein